MKTETKLTDEQIHAKLEAGIKELCNYEILLNVDPEMRHDYEKREKLHIPQMINIILEGDCESKEGRQDILTALLDEASEIAL
jgi:hypothetical protein